MRARRKAVAAAFVAWLAAIPAGAQLQTGDIHGVASDRQGGPLAGATITLSGIGSPRIEVTDERGNFRFLGLYPGTYSLFAELAGFSPLEQSGVEVRVGAKVELALGLAPAVDDAITILSGAPLLSPRDQSQGPALSQRELDQIPTARDPWSLLRQAPGVVTDRINVGGNESGQQSDFSAAGALATDNTFAVDGVVLSDMGSVGASSTYFDFGAYEEVQLTTSSTDVAIQTAGVTINQVTKRGTNRWRGDGRYLRTEGDWQATPEETDGNRIDSVEEYGLNVGGPLRPNQAWIWAAYGESDIGNIAQGGQLDRTRLEDFNTKLNFSLGASSGVAHFWTNDKLKYGRNAGPLFAPEATLDQTTPQDIWKIEDAHRFGPNLYLDALYAFQDGDFTLSPKGGLDTDMYFDELGVARGSYWGFDQSAEITQYKVDGNAFFSTADWNHELKFGAGYREQENAAALRFPRGRFVRACEAYGCEPAMGVDAAPADRELVVWTRHAEAVTTEYDSAWIQDTLARDRWTITAGLRYDRQRGRNRAHSDPGNDEARGFLPAVDFPGNDANGLDWESIAPRLGVTLALGEERDTLLRGSYSRYVGQLGHSVISRTDPLAPYSYVYFSFTDANRDLVFDPAEADSLAFYAVEGIDVGNPASMVSPHRNDSDLEPHRTDEITLAVEHAFVGTFTASATVVWRSTTDLLELRDLAVDASGLTRAAEASDYERTGTREATLPGGRIVSVPTYDLRAGLERTGGQLLTNGDRRIEHRGISLGFHKPLSNRWGLRGNVTWSDVELEVGPESRRFDDPTDVLFTESDGSYGAYGDDGDVFAYPSTYGTKQGVVLNNRWSFNVSGVYEVAPDRPWGFHLAANVSGREGYPTPPYVGSLLRQLQLTPSLDDYRNPDIYTVDARIEKEFRYGDLGITAALDIFNLFDRQTVLQVNRNFNIASEFSVHERLSPRVVRWGLTFHYR